MTEEEIRELKEICEFLREEKRRLNLARIEILEMGKEMIDRYKQTLIMNIVTIVIVTLVLVVYFFK